MLEHLSGARLRRSLLAGIQWFSHYRKDVDRINVFPVPDGDTGKNMYQAFQAAGRAIALLTKPNASDVAWAAARGALTGGRGCSGMILSGFFSGFAEGVGERATLTADDMVRALHIGCLRARERVEHPKEGTILTVGEAAAHAAKKASLTSRDIFYVLEAACKGAQQALLQTQQQLQELKAHHVVDAGGQGLVYFYEGMVRYGRRQVLDDSAAEHVHLSSLQPSVPRHALFTPFKFCTELILESPHSTVEALRKRLKPQGEDLMIAASTPAAGVFKIHLHTKDPEPVFADLETVGTISWRKVENMEEQHHDTFKVQPKP